MSVFQALDPTHRCSDSRELERRLKERVIAQDEAVNRVRSNWGYLLGFSVSPAPLPPSRLTAVRALSVDRERLQTKGFRRSGMRHFR